MEIPLIENFYKNQILEDLFNEDSKLKDFHNGLSVDHIDMDFIKKRDLDKNQRNILFNVLNEQYINTELDIPNDLKLIKNKGTFTVTTGHQLCVFGGPQYFIHKIVSVLKLTDELRKKFKDFNFIPIFWMASEDHDFEEISQLNIFNNKLSIIQEDGVEVGKINPVLFTPILNQLKEIFQNDNRFDHLETIFSNSLKKNTWSEATRYWIHRVFEKENLVVLDADDKRLKKIFQPIIQKELKEQFIYHSVKNTNQLIKELGFDPKIKPRELNLFYLGDQKRTRIIFENNQFKIGNRSYKLEEIINELNKFPEKFSPNVLMRPLYQEHILPNLIYVGGPSELSYWLQLKESFSKSNLNFPILLLRDHFLWIDEKNMNKWKDLGFSINDFSKNPDNLIKAYFLNSQNLNLDFSNETDALEKLSILLKDKAINLDVTLIPSIDASIKAMTNSVEKIKNKLIQSLKRNESQKVNQINKLSRLVHENGKLRERSESFLPSFLKSPNDYIDKLKKASDPENPCLKLII